MASEAGAVWALPREWLWLWLWLCLLDSAEAQNPPTLSCDHPGGLVAGGAGFTATSADGAGPGALFLAAERSESHYPRVELDVGTGEPTTAGYASEGCEAPQGSDTATVDQCAAVTIAGVTAAERQASCEGTAPCVYIERGSRARHPDTGWPYAALAVQLSATQRAALTDGDAGDDTLENGGITVEVRACLNGRACSGDFDSDQYLTESEGMVAETFTLGATIGFNVGLNYLYYFAQDQAGDVAQCIVQVIVNDYEGPAIQCPADITTTTDIGETAFQVGENFAAVTLQYDFALYMDNVVPVGAVDNVDDLPVTMKVRGGVSGATRFIEEGETNFNIGETVVEYKVFDGNGFTAMWAKCEMRIIVLDEEAPGQETGIRGDIGCPSEALLPRVQETELDANYAEVTLSYSDIVAVDNSGVISSIEIRYTEGSVNDVSDSVSPSPEGLHQFTVNLAQFGSPLEHTIEYSAIDPSGNVGDCTVTIEVSDIQEPVLHCPPPRVDDGNGHSTEPGENYYEVTIQGFDSDQVNGAVCEDNTGCGIIQARYGAIDGPIIVTGDSQTTYNFLLDAGRTQTHEVYFVAKDSPCEQCQAQYGANAIGCTAFCSTTNDAQGWDGGSIAGNTGFCTWTIMVKDSEPPVLSCPTTITSSSITGPDAGNLNADLQLANPLATDAPAQAGMEGFPYKTLTIQAASVVDNSGEPLGVNATLEGGQPIDSAYRFPIGSTVVTYTAIDNSGNEGICSTTVQVVDVEDPIMQCPSARSLDTDPDLPYATFDLPTPGSGDHSGRIADNSGQVSYETEILVQPGIVPPGNPDNRFYYGETAVRYTATDPAGRTSSCTLSIVVTDREAPSLTCPLDITRSTDVADGSPASCTGADDGTGTGTPCALNDDSTACDVPGPDCVYTPDHFDVGYAHRVVRIEGAEAGVVDNAVFGDIADLVVTASIDGIDISVGTAFVDYEFPIGDTVIRYYATDLAAHSTNGNTGECFRTITVEDNEPPAISCPENVVVSTTPYDQSSPIVGRDPANTSGAPNAIVTLVAATVRDNSGDILAVDGPTGVQSFDIGLHTLTYQSSDHHGQTSNCDVTITVEDNEAPILTCPNDLTLDLFDNDLNYRDLTVLDHIGLAGVTDNNDLPNVPVPVATVEAPDKTPGRYNTVVNITTASHRFYCCESSPTIVTFTAVDSAQNVGQCTMTVTVVDVQDPVLTCSSVPDRLTFPDSMSEPSGLPYHRLVMAGPSIDDNSGEDLTATAVIVQADRIEEGLDTAEDAQGMLVTPVQITYDTQTTQYIHDFYIGNSIVRFTAVDSTGRSGSCETQVTVVDNEVPVIVDSVVQGATRHCIAERTIVRITGTCQDEANGDTVDVQPLCEAIVTNGAPSTWNNIDGTCVTADGNTYNARQVCDLTEGRSWLTGQSSWTGLIPRVSITDNSGDEIAPVAYRGNPVSNVVIPVNNDDPTKIGPVELPISQLSFGQAVITFVATDGASNEESCELRVLVQDVEPPVLTCPEDRTVTTSGTSADVEIPDAAVTDNSETHAGEYLSVLQPTASYYHEINDMTAILTIGGTETFPLNGNQEYTEAIITYTSRDSANNSATCDWTLTVTDNEAPTVDCPLTKIVTTSVGRNFAEVALERLPPAAASDNSHTVGLPYLNANDGVINTFVRFQPSDILCDGVPFVSRMQDGCLVQNVACDRDGLCSDDITGIFEIGEHTVRYSADDEGGNTGFCELQVVVEDEEAPTVDCPSDLRGEANHEVTDTHSPTRAIILNRLGGVGSSRVSDNSCYPSNPCSSMFAIPSVNGVDLVTAQTLDGNGLNTQPFEFPIGFTEVLYTATDASNNRGHCVQRIEVRDEESPRLTCPTQNVYLTSSVSGYVGFARVNIAGPEDVGVLENSGEELREFLDARFTRVWHPVYQTSAMLDAGSTQSPNLNQASVTSGNGNWAFPIGLTTVTYYVSDAAQNEGTCSIQLEVLDDHAPRLSCPPIPTTNTNLDEAVATVEIMGVGSTPSVLDNNPADDSIILVPHAEYVVGPSSCENTPGWFDSHTQTDCTVFDDPEHAAVFCSSDGCADASADQATCEAAGACAFAAAVDPTCSGAGQAATCTGGPIPSRCSGSATDSNEVCEFDNGVCPVGCDVIPETACELNSEQSDCADLGGGQCTFSPAITCTLNATSSGCENSADGQCTFIAGSDSSCSARSGSADGGNTAMAASAACCACSGGSTAGSPACDPGEYFSAGECIAVLESPTTINFPIGETPVTYYATDSHDNTGQCVAQVVVVDTQPPDLNCPPDLQFTGDAGQSFALVDVNDLNSFPTIGSGDVSDNSGEDLVATIKPNIYDTTTCASYTESECNAHEDCTFDGSSCSGSFYVELSGPTQFQIGQTEVYFTAEDAASNVGFCTILVEVLDDEAPVLICPDDVSVTTDSGEPFSAITLQYAQVSDNSGVQPDVIAHVDPDSPLSRCSDGSTPSTGGLCDDGADPVTMIQFPHNFMFGACPAEFPFPVTNETLGLAGIVCFNNIEGAAQSSGELGSWCLLQQFADELRASDANSLVEQNAEASYCDPAAPKSATIVRFTAEDSANNMGSCTMTVTVQDDEDPVLGCPAHQSIPTDPSGSPTATVSFQTASVVDNSGTILHAVTDAQEGPFPIGASVLTYSAIDASSNVGQCQIDIFVHDHEAPVLTCPDDLTADSDNGEAFATMTLVLPEVVDNSGETPTATAMRDVPGWVDGDGVDCAVVASDTSLCSGLVDQNGVTAADACMACGGGQVINASPAPTFGLGDTVVTYFATDSVRTSAVLDGTSVDTGGNTGSCTYTLTILDNQVPGVACPLNQVQYTDQGAPFATLTLSTAEVVDNSDAVLAAYASVADVPVGPSQLTNLPSPTFRYDGGSFNSSGTIVQCDDFASRPGATAQQQCESWCGAANCGCTMDSGTGQCTGFPAAVYDVVYSAADDENNTGTCTMQVTIIDNQIPVLSCPGPQTVATTLGTTIAHVDLQPAEVSDNSGETLVASAALIDGTPVGIHGVDTDDPNDFQWTGSAPRGVEYMDVVYSATDSSGNTGFCTITITVPERDDCAGQPCVHGICTDRIGDYECTCDPGWSGLDCDIDINECELSPCKSPGTVLCQDSTTVNPDGDGSQLMGCPPQTGGEYAYNADFSDCIPVDTYRCTCQDRYSGFDCEFLDECSFDPCHRPQAIDENYGRLLNPNLLDSFFTNEGPGLGSVGDPTRFLCDASEIVENFNGESFDRFLCVDPNKTVTGDFYCRCPTCAETIFESEQAASLTSYFAAHPSMQLHVVGEVRKDQQTNGECIDRSLPREGCMDPLATNYDSLANLACADPPGETASPEACVSTDPVNVDPGCAQAVMDSDISANEVACITAASEGGGCTYVLGGCPCREARLGCMIPEAVNYDEHATVDDPNNPCVVESTPTDECAGNPCENVYYFQTNDARGATRPGSTDGVCEEPWVCTDPNQHVLNDYTCTCPQAVCGLDYIFPEVTNFNLSVFLHRENTLKAHLLRRVAQPTTVGGCECMASWIVDDSADCPAAESTGQPICYETASPSQPADALACSAVADLTTGDACGQVQRADGSGEAACTYGAVYNGCGMDPPCDGRDGGVSGNSYCEVVDPGSCNPDPELGGMHDFCAPRTPSTSGRRLMAEVSFGNSTDAPAVNGSAV